MLSDREIHNLKPQPGKTQRLTDGQNLYLLVYPNGARGWRWDYTFDGRRKTISLGRYTRPGGSPTNPIVTLKRAREKRVDAERLLDRGIDPSVAKQEAKSAVVASDTFAAVAEEFFAKHQKEIDPGTWSTKKSRLEQYLVPRLGSLTISRIEAKHILACVKPIDALGKHDTARRVRQLVGAIFEYAIATDRATADPSARLTKALTRVATKHRAALDNLLDMGRLVRAINGYTGSPVVAAALKLAPLVFLRPFELRNAEWKEFEFDNDLGPMWRIPVRRMKRTSNSLAVDHLVPLAPQAVAILRALHPLTGSGRLVFPGMRHRERPISDMTLTAALRRLGFAREEQSVHGFRTIGSTRCREIKFDGDLVELQLAHKIANPVRAAYDKAARVPERVAMMRAYADHLDDLVAKADRADAAARRGVPVLGPRSVADALAALAS